MYKIVRGAFLIGFVFNFNFSYSQVSKKLVNKNVHLPVKKAIPKQIINTPEIPHTETRVKISTSLGDIIVKLSDKTPKHRDNFIKLVNEHFYDSTLFHRVINSFMIQGGDPNSKNALPAILLGQGGTGYTIPAEFDSTLFHKKGALAAARDNNPEKASSGCQFYIVQGKKLGDSELDMVEVKNNLHFSPAQRMTYKMNGGTPFLDRKYTVFGEVESGLDILDKIAQQLVDGNNRPLIDITIKMEVVKEEIK